MLGSWFHLTALALYLGSVIGLWIILLPAISVLQDHRGRAQLLARGLKLYNPMQIGTLGVVVVSGALQLTGLKAAYRELFTKALGQILVWKLVLSFALILLSVYLSMAVGHRFVRRSEEGEAFSSQDLEALTRRLKALTFFILLLAAITSVLGVRLRG